MISKTTLIISERRPQNSLLVYLLVYLCTSIDNEYSVIPLLLKIKNFAKNIQKFSLKMILLGEDVRKVQEIHWWWLRRQEEAKPGGKLYNWIRGKIEKHMLLLHWWVQDS